MSNQYMLHIHKFVHGDDFSLWRHITRNDFDSHLHYMAVKNKLFYIAQHECITPHLIGT